MRNDESIPTIIGAMPVLFFSRVDGRHRPTGSCVHIRSDMGLLEPAWGLVICKPYDGQGYYLYRCDDDWLPVTDTWHETIDEAKHQAEFEYEGIESTWVLTPQ